MRGLPGGRTAVLLLVALMLSLALPAGIGGTGVAGAEGSNERHLYVFADGPIDDLKIRKSSGGGDDIPFSEAPVTGNGYVRYAFELEPGNCFVPESSNHRFSVDPVGGICIWGNETDFVVRAFSTGAQVHLITMDQQVSPVWMEPEGEGYRLYGSFYFIEIDDADDYKLGILYPSSGSPDLASCPGHFDDAYYNYLDFSCLFNEIPHTIGVYAWSEIQNDWIPTNLMWRVEDPGNISVVDHAPGIRVVDPGIRLEDGHAESDIALYSVLWGGKIQYFPAEASVRFGESEIDFYNIHLRIGYVDTNGRPYVREDGLSLMDNIADETGRDDFFEVREGSGNYTPDDHAFLGEGGGAGKIVWTIPESSYDLIAYYLYFAGADKGIMRGLAGVYFSNGIPLMFEYMLPDIPEGAEYVEVVPLYAEFGDYYYAPSFFVELKSQGEPPLEPGDLVAGTNWGKLKAVDGGYEYRFAAKGTTAGHLINEFWNAAGLSFDKVEIQTRDGQVLPVDQPVPAGARVYLTRGNQYQLIDVRLLSDYVREKRQLSGSAPITPADIAAYVLGDEREDVNGDGVFDRKDVRLLLGEID